MKLLDHTPILLVALLIPVHVAASEQTLIGHSVFGFLSPTAVFDVNADGRVNAADLTARTLQPEPMSSGCDGPTAAQGELTIQIGPDLREYVVRLPADYDKHTPRAVILAYHGFGGDTAYMEAGTEIPQRWPDAIGVYPRGLNREISTFPGVTARGWQLAPGELGDRDVAFFDALLDRLENDYCIDPSRVYVTGHSNGAFFANTLGCERGNVLAGIAPRSGGLGTCMTDDQVSVIISHGMNDPIVPFFFGRGARNLWIMRDGCTDDVTAYDDRCQINDNCAAGQDVVFCPFGDGHFFDPAFPQELIRFFQEHARATV